MNAEEISTSLIRQIVIGSNLDNHRDYLGISKIFDCPRKAYIEYMDGIGDIDEATHRFCYAGYEQERSVISLLQQAGIGCLDSGLEVTAPFDNRLRGHIDGVTNDNELLEIKSLTVDKFRRVNADGRALFKHFVQVQLYMRYGGWKQAFIVYRCRETYEHFVVSVPYHEHRAEYFERKARTILDAIDAGVPPHCECGKCKKN